MQKRTSKIRDLSMSYGDFVIQKNLNFTVRRGDIFIIMGGSGCGKSTLLQGDDRSEGAIGGRRQLRQ
jgi:ABC-type Fe3+/spermidine/putrescine transport system ATPase subunit